MDPTKPIDIILEQGGIWAALFILTLMIGVIVAVYLQKKLDRCQEDLVESVRAFGDVTKANTVAITEWTNENAARTRAHEAMVQALALSTQEIATFKAEIAFLRDVLHKRLGGQP